ncbi:MAG: inorganic diphosphatase [Candidatus Aenigmatarchaeota archaeon]
MEISKIEPGSQNQFNVLITCEKNSRDYCEYDEKSDAFILKKVLSQSFPGYYGFIPKTHHIDAEPLDVLILTEEPLKQGIVVKVKPIGLIRLRSKIPDDVLIATLNETKDLLSLEKETLERLKSFLEELKGKEIEEIFGIEKAKKAVERAIELYKREFE